MDQAQPTPASSSSPAPSRPGATQPAPPPSRGSRCAAYFDLDKTVLATSTTFALGQPMRRQGLISTPTLARGVIAHLPYILRGADEEHTVRLMDKVAGMAAGLERARLQEVIAQALATAIEPTVYAEALDLIEAHHRAGHDVVIVSASITEMVEPVARLVGADRWVGTQMEVDAAGHFTGHVTHAVLHSNKVDALHADAAAHGIDLSASWAYSDSVSDLPMLEAVGHPVAVNPDKELRRYATEHGWLVRDFERPLAMRSRLHPASEATRLCLERAGVVASALALAGVAGAAAWMVARWPSLKPAAAAGRR